MRTCAGARPANQLRPHDTKLPSFAISLLLSSVCCDKQFFHNEVHEGTSDGDVDNASASPDDSDKLPTYCEAVERIQICNAVRLAIVSDWSAHIIKHRWQIARRIEAQNLLFALRD